MNKVLLDTNVLIYSTNYDSKYYSDTNKYINESNLHFYTTSKNLSEYLSVVTRKPNRPLKIDQAIELIDNFSSRFTILYPDSNSFSVFKNLLLKYKPIGLKIHDFEIISLSLANNVNSILTYNEKDFVEVKEVSLIRI